MGEFVYLFVVEAQEDIPTDVWLYRSSNAVQFDPLYAITKNGLDTRKFSQTDFALDIKNKNHAKQLCGNENDPIVYMQSGRDSDGAGIDVYKICWSKLDASKGGFWKKIDAVLTSIRPQDGSEFDLINKLTKANDSVANTKRERRFDFLGSKGIMTHVIAGKNDLEGLRNACFVIGGAIKRNERGELPSGSLEIIFGRGDGDPHCVNIIGNIRCSPESGASLRQFTDDALSPLGGALEYFYPPYSNWNLEKYISRYNLATGKANNPLINLLRRNMHHPKIL